MLKKLFKYFFISLILLAACAPKPKLMLPPPLYSAEELTLAEIISKVSGDVDVIKVIADIKIEKNNASFDSVSASVIVKSPGQVHMRVYKFGMLVRDFIIMDEKLYVLSGKSSKELKGLGIEFYNSVFWWDNMKDGSLQKKRKTYVVRNEKGEIHLDRATLLPLTQKILSFNNEIEVTYSEPQKSEDGYWYPSVIDIFVNNFKFNVKLKKLILNPLLGEADFQSLFNQ